MPSPGDRPYRDQDQASTRKSLVNLICCSTCPRFTDEETEAGEEGFFFSELGVTVVSSGHLIRYRNTELLDTEEAMWWPGV